MLEILYKNNSFIRLGLCILCLAEAIIAIVALTSNKQERTKKNIALTIVAIITFLFSGLLVWSDNLAQVPNLFEDTLEISRIRIENANLEVGSISGKGAVVIEQSIPMGTIIPKGTKIDLTTGDYRSSNTAIKEFEDSVGTGRRDFIGQFYRSEIELLSDNLDVQGCFGTKIDNINIRELYLANEEYKVCYMNYELDGGMIIFRDIPSSVEYKLVVHADGYKDAEFYIDLSWYDKAFLPLDEPMSLNLTKNNDVFEMASTIILVNDDLKNFLAWTDISVRWTNEDYFGSDIWYSYKTNSDGRFPYLVYIHDDYEIEVQVHDKDGYSIRSTLLLKKAFYENATDYYVQVKNDGSICIMTTEEYWNACKELEY